MPGPHPTLSLPLWPPSPPDLSFPPNLLPVPSTVRGARRVRTTNIVTLRSSAATSVSPGGRDSRIFGDDTGVG